MCGILGIINIESEHPIEGELLTKMASAMTHRGPDGAGVWIQPDRQVGLAHRRLSIVDLSAAGHQPMSTSEEKIWVTFNGEIYNYPKIRRDMEQRGHQFRSNSDTEVILHLYREYGEKFIDYLDGDFAIGLWDCELQRLILTRDRAGVKPLYYAYVDGKFIFASEIKAILRYPGIRSQINREAFYHYLTFLVVPPSGTLINGIQKLEAASTLRLTRGPRYCPFKEKYWLPLPKVETQRSFQSFDEELEALLSASVKKRLMADVPVGVLFSGGVDSTLNLCSFSELIKPAKVKTFTVGISGGGNYHDDAGIAKNMAERLGSDHSEVQISERDIMEQAEKLAYFQDEPISDPVAIPLYFVTKLAKERGVTVLQAGEGADELFCGYENYRRFIRHYEKYWQPLSHLPRWVGRIGSAAMSVSEIPRIRKIRDVLERHGKGQKLFMSSAVAYYEKEKQVIISKEFQRVMGESDSFNLIAPYYEEIEKLSPNATFLQKITFIELQMRLPELLLMRADKMSMANSVEIRVPFLDKDIMDFAMRVPDQYKLRNGVSKEPLKRLATKFVSKQDVYRPKTGFGLPIHNWFNGRMGEQFIDELNSDSEIGEYLDKQVLTNKIKKGLDTVNDGFQIWVLYNYLMWKKSIPAA